MSIIIEKAKPTDAQKILEYLKQIGAETENLSFGGEGLAIAVADEEKYLAKLENSKDNIMFLAKEDGKIVGDASLTRLPRRMYHRGELGMAVLKEYWRRGIGEKLLCNIITFAKENSFEILDLQVRSDNLPAIQLYKKHGFKVLCTHPKFFKIVDNFISFDLMYLELK